MKYIVIILCFTPLLMVGQNMLPSVEVKTLNGKEVNIQDAVKENKLTVLSFWATWCKPCQKELSNIADIYPMWQEELGVELIAVTIDDARGLAKVKPMISRKGWNYSFLSDVNQDLQRALNFRTIPQTFVVNSKGEILYSHTGYVPGNEFELEDKLKKLAE